jgi:hypothetical protein
MYARGAGAAVAGLGTALSQIPTAYKRHLHGSLTPLEHLRSRFSHLPGVSAPGMFMPRMRAMGLGTMEGLARGTAGVAGGMLSAGDVSGGLMNFDRAARKGMAVGQLSNIFSGGYHVPGMGRMYGSVGGNYPVGLGAIRYAHQHALKYKLSQMDKRNPLQKLFSSNRGLNPFQTAGAHMYAGGMAGLHGLGQVGEMGMQAGSDMVRFSKAKHKQYLNNLFGKGMARQKYYAAKDDPTDAVFSLMGMS